MSLAGRMHLSGKLNCRRNFSLETWREQDRLLDIADVRTVWRWGLDSTWSR